MSRQPNNNIAAQLMSALTTQSTTVQQCSATSSDNTLLAMHANTAAVYTHYPAVGQHCRHNCAQAQQSVSMLCVCQHVLIDTHLVHESSSSASLLYALLQYPKDVSCIQDLHLFETAHYYTATSALTQHYTWRTAAAAFSACCCPPFGHIY
jgi:hypothetical protein